MLERHLWRPSARQTITDAGLELCGAEFSGGVLLRYFSLRRELHLYALSSVAQIDFHEFSGTPMQRRV